MREGNHSEELNIYQASLSVLLIATDRSAFEMCLAHELLADVFARTFDAGFDFVPVVEGDAIIGVLPAHELRMQGQSAGIVKEHMKYLDEGFLIGSDASILEFIRDADFHPFRFVVKGRQVSGLVSLSDLQNLPVRAALFAMVTQLEMALADLIRRVFPGDEWINRLNETRQQKLRDEISQARADDNQVEPLLYTQLPDKSRIAVSYLVGRGASKKQLTKELREVDKLRNKLAHANQFAASREEARRVCEVVRSIDGLIQMLEIESSRQNQ